MPNIFKKIASGNLPKTPGKKAKWLEEIMNSDQIAYARDPRSRANVPDNLFETTSKIPIGFSKYALKKSGTHVLLLTPKAPPYLPKDQSKDIPQGPIFRNDPKKKVGKVHGSEEDENRRWGYYRSGKMC